MTSAVHSAVHCQVAECPQCESFAIIQLERMVINNAVVSSKASVTFHLALLVVTDGNGSHKVPNASHKGTVCAENTE